MNPLISVVVITYNSSNFVLDALNSIKNQSLSQEIELIISDDCSTDDTCRICEDWLSDNASCFYKTHLIKASKNGGVAVNCNKAFRTASGQWVKLLAGDDALLPDCLSVLRKFIVDNPGAEVITAQRKVYLDCIEDSAFQYVSHVAEAFLLMSNEQCLKVIAKENYHFPVADCIKRTTWEKLGGYDEKYMFEDLSFAIRFLEAGGKYSYCPIPIVAYRKNSSSLTGNDNSLFSYRYMRDLYRINRDYCFKYTSKRVRMRYRLHWWTVWMFQHLGLNKPSDIVSFLYHGTFNIIDRLLKFR